MSWFIRGYDRKNDKLRTEICVDDLLRDFFQRILGLSDNDPMVDSYPLSPDVMDQLIKMFGCKIMESDQDFFLDFDA